MHNNHYASPYAPPAPQYYNYTPDPRYPSEHGAYPYSGPPTWQQPPPPQFSHHNAYPQYNQRPYVESQWHAQLPQQQQRFPERSYQDHSSNQDRSSADNWRSSPMRPNAAAPPFHPTAPVHSQPRREPTPKPAPSPRPRLKTQRLPDRPLSPPHSTPSSPPTGRKPKVARSQPGISLTPSALYLSATKVPVFDIVPSLQNPPLLVLDLNNCILFRKERTNKGSKIPIPRPYLAPFLEYVCGFERISWVAGEGGEVGRRFSTAVYSSARSYNVLSMLSALSLVPPERAAAHEKGTPWVALTGDALGLVFTREMMGLNAKEFEQNVETVKDLEPLWKNAGGKWGAERTVLVDDEPFKASLQPYNHLPIEPFFVQPQDLPASPPSSPLPLPAAIPASTNPSLIFPNLPNDTALLSTTYILSVLRTKSNVASFIRGGGLDPLRALGEEELAKRGEQVLESLGIDLRKDWDPEWWSKCCAVKGVVPVEDSDQDEDSWVRLR